jgi:hypothetical protein
MAMMADPLSDFSFKARTPASFQPPSAYDRNAQWAKLGPYVTQLKPPEEQAFRAWLQTNRQQTPIGRYNPDNATEDYDMRGFWKAMVSGDPRAKGAVNPSDQSMHFPDTWKTPHHHSFSRESIYATKDAPEWKGSDQGGWYLQDKHGQVVYDERVSR